MVALRKSFLSSRRRASRLEEKAYIKTGPLLGIIWSNDDDDQGPAAGDDIPGRALNKADYNNAVVDSVRDLVDFFPVYLDIKQLLTVLPPSASVKYKLKQADEGLRFVYTDLSRADSLKYLKDYATGNGLKNADAHRMTVAGYELDATWLGQVKDADKGVILVEGRNATDKPMVLSVEKADGTVLAEMKLEIKISPIEQMFRHKNLDDGPDAPSDAASTDSAGLVGARVNNALETRADDPVGFPDATCSDTNWLIFVHGFNVTGQAARGWNAEMFKRLYWSGNKARFVGVSWFGSPDKPPGGLGGALDLPADYYKSVRNAFTTAPLLAQFVNGLSGGHKTTVSHSLGCGVVGSAIADYGMVVNHACFVDAALPREAFDGSAANEIPGMVPTAWQNSYSVALWAANWNQRFASSDARSKLSWQNRFTSGAQTNAAPVIHNFYSSTEDVLSRYDSDVPDNQVGLVSAVLPGGIHSWVISEKTKGRMQSVGIGIYTLQTIGTTYGGWGFNLTDPVSVVYPIYYKNRVSTFGYMLANRDPLSAAEVNAIDPLPFQLKAAPVFDPGWGSTQGIGRNYQPSVLRGPSWIQSLYDTPSDTTTGNGIAAVASKRAELLAEAIPALSLPVGSRTTNAFTENYDMPEKFADNWPSLRGTDPTTGLPNWHHSDMREIAYIYQHRFVEKLVEISKQ